MVFQFLTDPEKMIRWMGIKVEIDPRPGDVYRVEPNGKDIIRGKYIEIVPDSRWLASLQKPSIISAELDKEHTGA